MEIAKTYDPSEVEEKWYQYWLDHQFFASHPNPDKEPYTIVIPPPNVTGVLHMGHMLNNTIQDVLIRKARMEGKEACWVPGTDHASIATEARVVAMLKEKGISKKDISREEFLQYARDWKDKYGGIILEQLKKLGASCDWNRTRYTMEESLSESVTNVFVDLYRKGHIYRGVRMVNWDPQGKTAVSDEEVLHKEVQSKLYYVRYDSPTPDPSPKGRGARQESNSLPFREGWGGVVIATTRPETIMADTAVCVHPADERYKHLHGKKVLVPLVNREIPVILDEYVSMEFGTGCLKVTPAHDINDYELGLKHNLPVIDIFNDDGTLNEKAQVFVGDDRFVARKKVAAALEETGLLEKVEDYKSSVGYSERTNAVIEPRLSMQWFLKMKELSKPALDAVMNEEVRLIPDKFKNTYRHWMENVHDWCISRQLWWGHRIPAWYVPDGSFVVAETVEKALELARQKTNNLQLTINDLQQDPDVLDTWFSSWLWPITVFDGLKDPDNEDIKYYYPTNDLVTAPEILFFWVARMIIAGYEYRKEKPFQNVYLTGIVRDKLGRKMSKSLGNSPDPIELIKQYSADGVRTGMLFSSPAGNDLPFDEKLCEQGRNFCNKIWNAFRLVKGWEVSGEPSAISYQPSVINDKSSAKNTTQSPPLKADSSQPIAIRWFESRFSQALVEIEDHFTKYRLSDALQSVYKLIWDDFCAWYLEMVKPTPPAEGQRSVIDQPTYEATIDFFERLMKLAHPFMPFITEEIWHGLRERGERDCIIVASWPKASEVDASLLAEAEIAFDIIKEIRSVRSSKGMSPKTELALSIRTENQSRYERFSHVIEKLANTSQIQFTSEKVSNAVSLMVKGDEIFIPLEEEMDVDKEIAEAEKRLAYLTGFRESIHKKLSNERFVQNAKPDVIARECQKLADTEAEIKALEERLADLRNRKNG